MKKIISGVVAVLIPFFALADGHGKAEAEVRAAVETFNTAYATNDVETYFGHYMDDATLFFYGQRQVVAEYHERWTASVAAGGGVEKNDISDVRVKVLAGGNSAISSYFVDNASRSPEGDVSTATAYESEVWSKIDGKWRIVSLHYTEFEPAE